MNIQDAIEYLEKQGLKIYRQEADLILGATSLVSRQDPNKREVYDPFNIYFDPDNQLWLAHLTFAQAVVIIKAQNDLDTPVLGIKQFYTLCKHMHEQIDEAYLAFIRLQKIGFIADMFDDDAIRVWLPPKKYRLLKPYQRMMESVTLDKPDKEFFIRLEADQWLVEEQLRVESSIRGRFSTLEEVLNNIPSLYPELNE